MQFSRSTLALFGELLNQCSIPSGHPQIVELAQQIELGRRELHAAVEEAEMAALTEANADV